MTRRLRRKTWPRQAAVVAFAVLTVAVGLCLFDDEGAGTDHHDISRDLCGGVLVSTLTVTLMALSVLNPVFAESLRPVSAVTLRRLDPPPKFPQLP
jgi:hypothetical protein